ncbi:inhibitor of nuclear factor kappa-B kinase-interacting protein isoform X1 [Pseudorasbora parva]|uniref:inhibitor of nuclear factor kappa-B kinase-interacting protein isoform X1 n=1 Tax=Pseudorasbora parva TaxID=51549 RepID=UPI00351F5939
MQTSDLKQRQKSSNKQQNGEKKKKEDENKNEDEKKKKESVDVKLCVSLLCLALSLLVTGLHLQQRATLAEMRGKSRSVEQLDEKLTQVARQCALLSPAEAVSAELAHLEQRFSGLSAQREQLQRDRSALERAVEEAETRARLLSATVASVRTDVRRMAGLEAEVEALLNHTHALEETVSQTEKLMVKRIGDQLAGSIDRISALKSSAERNGQRLDRVSALALQLSAEHRQLSERILALESGQAKLRRTVSFADDLKPKVFTIRQDFALVEPRLADLTLRIGQIAEDLRSRGGELEELRELKRDDHKP